MWIYIIGAGRSGTSSLYDYLALQPSIYGGEVKEPGWLVKDTLPLGSPELKGKIRSYPEEDPGVNYNLDGSTYYSQYYDLFRARCMKPAKIIYITRDSSERCISSYKYFVSEGFERLGFWQSVGVYSFRQSIGYSLSYDYLEDSLDDDIVEKLNGEEDCFIIKMSQLNDKETLQSLMSWLDLPFYNEITIQRKNPSLGTPMFSLYILNNLKALKNMLRLGVFDFLNFSWLKRLLNQRRSDNVGIPDIEIELINLYYEKLS
jgi:hypothetical protein